MKTQIPARFYVYDYGSFIIRASVVAAVCIIVYSTLFGVTW